MGSGLRLAGHAGDRHRSRREADLDRLGQAEPEQRNLLAQAEAKLRTQADAHQAMVVQAEELTRADQDLNAAIEKLRVEEQEQRDRIAAAEGISFAWLRLFSAYGPADDPERLAPYVISRLLAGKSAAILRLARRALRDGADGRFSEALARVERVYGQDLLATQDVDEGVQAFLEKRPPRWKDG